ncbi:radical SAM protein [bacterium]|nr:radical SAM protein [bacterium]
MRLHPIGKLSKTGVLDVGRKCTHSCVFCFYSFYDDYNEQFHYLRHAPFLPKEQLKNVLRHFVDWDLTHFDYTGGEPSLHPDIVEITDYAHHELGLKGRMITLAQFFQRKFRGSENTLLDDLLQAGINDFLFSFHTIDDALFKQMTGENLDKMKRTMDILDDKDFSYCANTVVNEHNYKSLPATARYLATKNLRIHNFIMMRMDWGLRNQKEIAVGHKGRYTEVAAYVKEAIDILEAEQIAVNVRYAPFCIFKNYERTIVGCKGIQLDAYEWRNGTKAASEGTPFLKNTTEEDYYRNRVPLFENDPVYNLVFGEKCQDCALRTTCDGVDKTYIDKYGWDEFEPYDGEKIQDIVHFRYDYPGPFWMKEAQYEPSWRPVQVVTDEREPVALQ